ncbi:MAG: STAS domain-containing protein [Candidatus Solibacter usitatus]|nr:STAS domain-containing protein [Candidatus Solibacter usitatus]
MSVQIQTREINDVTVMACSGTITLGQATSLFRNTLREILQNGAKKVLLDLNDVSYLDSTGIGELVGAYTSAHNAQAQIKLSRLPEKIYNLLQITKLVTVFEIFDDEAEAIRSFE